MLRRTSGEHLGLRLLLCGERNFLKILPGDDIFVSFDTFSKTILQLLVGFFRCWMKTQSGHFQYFSLNTLRIGAGAVSMALLEELSPMT